MSICRVLFADIANCASRCNLYLRSVNIPSNKRNSAEVKMSLKYWQMEMALYWSFAA